MKRRGCLFTLLLPKKKNENQSLVGHFEREHSEKCLPNVVVLMLYERLSSDGLQNNVLWFPKEGTVEACGCVCVVEGGCVCVQTEQGPAPGDRQELVTATSPPTTPHAKPCFNWCVCLSRNKEGRVRQPDQTRPGWTRTQSQAPGPGQQRVWPRALVRFGFYRPLPVRLFLNVC